MRIQYKPLVRYIWLGAFVMAVGGLVAATDRRYRVRVTAASSDPRRANLWPRRPVRSRVWETLSRQAARLTAPDVEVPATR